MEMQKKISFSLVFTQTRNFVRNRITQFALVSLTLALFHAFFNSFFDKQNLAEQIYVSRNLTNYILFVILTLLIGIILKAISIATISNLYINDKLNLNLLLSKALSNTLKIILFYLIIGAFVFLVSFMLSIVLISLNLLLPKAVIFILIFLVLLIPILILIIFCNFFLASLVEPGQNNILDSLSSSIQLSKTQWRPAILMVLICLGFVMVFAQLAIAFDNDNFILDTLFSFCSIFFDIFVTSFFYRLYTLATNHTNSNFPTKDDQQETDSLIV
ncbi:MULTISPECIES: hypothetical protein [unclassified Gilliamella]|uniref:hypothetical protein n=1 Tax=unclassified Gilliamella TaxID=2685620 RepID=UPI00130B2245|nr:MULTISPECIES: hypothetical protein [unclassified Gilliamella]MWP49924.1 hypothetical protein [Gilliamella sp. Lep-s35]MWP69555.1 hypothetical protein [Gilliamella sp. Lep-s5]MWP77861.1 hypothetical protein [Gilliamella sp. Lep-s21]